MYDIAKLAFDRTFAGEIAVNVKQVVARIP
jgi:hypothetical protein